MGGDDLIAAFEKGDEAAARSGPASGEAAEDALGLFDSSDTGMGGNASSLLAGLSEDDGGADLFGDGGQEGDDLFSMVRPCHCGVAAARLTRSSWGAVRVPAHR